MPLKKTSFVQKSLTVVVIGLLLTAAYFTSSTLLLLFLTYIIAQGLSPIVTWVDDKTPLNRSLSVVAVVVVTFVLLGLLSWLSIQVFVNDFNDMLGALPSLIDDITERVNNIPFVDVEFNQKTISDNLPQASDLQSIGTNFASSIVNIGGNIVGMFLTGITLSAVTFYQVNNPAQVRNFLVGLSPKKHRGEAISTVAIIEKKLGNWLLGQLSLVLLLGFFSFIGFKIFGLPFALPLAVLAGLSDIVPVVGPVVTFIPLIIVAFASLPLPLAIGVILYFLIIQQLEGNIIVPKLMESAVGLEGILVIIALMLGSQLAGILGALLAIPGAIVLKELYLVWQKHR